MAIITANTVPSTTIHQGAKGGILMASSRPVSRAELSARILLTAILRSLRTRASATRALTQPRTICSSVPQPKNQT
ncbi:hypothetical protein D3C76_1633580 [compost metagenome]